MAERTRLVALGGLLVALVALYLGLGLRAPYGFILTLRLEKLAALLLVGAACGAATVIFQTLAANRLLTPGIVGFDALFIFLQTFLVLSLGGSGYVALPEAVKFLAETVVLTGAALLLFGLLLRRGADDILRMLLTGVVLGVLLRGLANFAQRLLDPNEFAVVQQATVASFTAVPVWKSSLAAGLLLAGLGAAMALAGRLDIAALGRTKARLLGLGHDRLTLVALAVVAMLVSVSTALVGPVVFLGLLAASLARALFGDHRHAALLPAAAMIGAAILVGGQTIFERVLGLQSALAVVVEFVGGLLFLVLVLRRPKG